MVPVSNAGIMDGRRIGRVIDMGMGLISSRRGPCARGVSGRDSNRYGK